MVIDVFKENDIQLKSFNGTNYNLGEGDDSEIQKIKSHLDISYLKYVSENVKYLLKLNIEDDKECFEKRDNHLGMRDKYRVILYIRLSVEDGDVIDGDVSRSIRNQLLILLDECEKRNWIVVAIFCEEGISGADDSRPEWNKSLKFCENGNTEIVLCKSQSRFSRSMEMIEKYLHNEFIVWNIRFVGLVDSTDTSIAGNKKTRQINGLVNEWQVEDQSINIRAVLKNKQSNGLFTGSFAPYGYMKDPKDKYHFIIDEDAAKVVKKIFEMYASGMGATKICAYLNENKIPTRTVYKHQKGSKYNCPSFIFDKRIKYQVEKDDTLIMIANRFQSGVKEIMEYNSLKREEIKEGQIIIIPVIYRWGTTSVFKILKDEVYTGCLIQHKNERISYKNKKTRRIPEEQRIIVPHCHEPIIDQETWRIVSERSEKRTRTRSGKTGNIPLFSGKIKCECCGHSFYRDIKVRKGINYNYWRCGHRYITALTACRNNKSMKETDLCQLIIEEINKQLDIYYEKTLVEKNYYAKTVNNSIDKEIDILSKEKSNIENNVMKKERTLALLYEDRANGIIDTEEFSMIKNKNSIDIKSLKERITQINKEITNLQEKKKQKIDTEKILKKYNRIEKLDRNILDEFISKIYIGYYNEETKTRKIKLEWNIYT